MRKEEFEKHAQEIVDNADAAIIVYVADVGNPDTLLLNMHINGDPTLVKRLLLEAVDVIQEETQLKESAKK